MSPANLSHFSSWWHRLGRFRRYGPDGWSMSLGGRLCRALPLCCLRFECEYSAFLPDLVTMPASAQASPSQRWWTLYPQAQLNPSSVSCLGVVFQHSNRKGTNGREYLSSWSATGPAQALLNSFFQLSPWFFMNTSVFGSNPCSRIVFSFVLPQTALRMIR